MKNIIFAMIMALSLFAGCTQKNDPKNETTASTENKIAAPPQLIQVENIPNLKGVSFYSNNANLLKDNILLFTNGTITFESEFKPKKQNTLLIEGLGSLLKNEPVKVDVVINDVKVDQIEFSKDSFEAKNIKFKTDKSKLTVQLNFVNDYYNQETKEDRNFTLKSISIK